MSRKSLFEELNELAPVTSPDTVIEGRANHVISSAINLMEFIETHYSKEDASNLHRRLLSSIKGKDTKRFTRALCKINKDSD